jgi:hypothetical protein
VFSHGLDPLRALPTSPRTRDEAQKAAVGGTRQARQDRTFAVSLDCAAFTKVALLERLEGPLPAVQDTARMQEPDESNPRRPLADRITMSSRNSTLSQTLAVAGACFAGTVAHAAASEDEQCSAFIETARPGVNVIVPYGAFYRSLGQARKDALNRCRLTNLAEEGWGPLCRTRCVSVDHQKTAHQICRSVR